MEKSNQYEIFSLGDSALTIDLGNRICTRLNQKALLMREWMLDHPFEGLKDVILGYSSLSLLYDPFFVQKKNKIKTSSFSFVKQKLEEAYHNTGDVLEEDVNQIDLPVCYEKEFARDLDFVAAAKHLSPEEVINIHLSRSYRVYMMGFLPGFAYMGEVDQRIQVPRKTKPVEVTAGSVGITGGQTGIYPLDSPGGWQIIGRTPWKLFDASSDGPVKLEAGQFIRFYRIGVDKFYELHPQ